MQYFKSINGWMLCSFNKRPLKNCTRRSWNNWLIFYIDVSFSIYTFFMLITIYKRIYYYSQTSLRWPCKVLSILPVIIMILQTISKHFKAKMAGGCKALMLMIRIWINTWNSGSTYYGNLTLSVFSTNFSLSLMTYLLYHFLCFCS